MRIKPTGNPAFVFRDRKEAGQRLAELLSRYADQPEVVVVGLPRGGVVVASEVAKTLHAPLEVFLAHKLPVPGYEELAMGAVTTGEICIRSDEIIQPLGIPEEVVQKVIDEQRQRLMERERMYRRGRPPIQIRHRVVILVDDGIATGSTLQAAILALRQQQPKRLIVAVPVAAKSSCLHIQTLVDELVTLVTPLQLNGVGSWYENFSQISDEEVSRLLDAA